MFNCIYAILKYAEKRWKVPESWDAGSLPENRAPAAPSFAAARTSLTGKLLHENCDLRSNPVYLTEAPPISWRKRELLQC